jgi:hypothetical protein
MRSCLIRWWENNLLHKCEDNRVARNLDSAGSLLIRRGFRNENYRGVHSSTNSHFRYGVDEGCCVESEGMGFLIGAQIH